MDDIFDAIHDYEESRWVDGFNAGEADAARRSYLDGLVFGVDKGLEKGHAMGVLHGRALVWSARVPPIPDETGTTTTPTTTATTTDAEEPNPTATPPSQQQPPWPTALRAPLAALAAALDTANAALRATVDAKAAAPTTSLPAQLRLTTAQRARAAAVATTALPAPLLPASVPTSSSSRSGGSGSGSGNSGGDGGADDAPGTPNPRLRRHLDALLALTDPASLDPSNADAAVEAWEERFRRAVAKAKVVEKILGEAAGGAAAAGGEDDDKAGDEGRKVTALEKVRRSGKMEDF
jgi:hypothetical protein